MRYFFPLIFLFCLMSGCTRPDPQKIMDKSIAFYNIEKLLNATLEFRFRNASFKAMQKNGKFQYERTFTPLLVLSRDNTNKGKAVLGQCSCL